MSNKKVISKLLAIGTAVTVIIASSITAFASGVIFLRYTGMAGSCGYSGEAYINKGYESGSYDTVGAFISSVQTADLSVRGYGTHDGGETRYWYSGGMAQTTDVGASAKAYVSIQQNVGTAYISSDDGDEQYPFILYRQ